MIEEETLRENKDLIKKIEKKCWKEIRDHTKDFGAILKHIRQSIKKKELMAIESDALVLRIHLDSILKNLYVLDTLEEVKEND